jgi:hypothetical protein
MSPPYYTLFPLAQQDRTQNMVRAFRSARNEDGSGVMYAILILAGIAAAIFILWRVFNAQRKRFGSTSPWGLFFSLCQAHKLKWSERWLLWRLAKLKHLTDPGRLFLEPEWYKISRLPAALRPRAVWLGEIRKRLFAGMKEGVKFIGDQQPPSTGSPQSKGAALPTLNAPPALDISPWPAGSFVPPPGPITDSPDSAAV